MMCSILPYFCARICNRRASFRHRRCSAQAVHESIFVLDGLVHKTVGSEFQDLAECDIGALRRQSVQREI
jgi:hypothetical protein